MIKRGRNEVIRQTMRRLSTQQNVVERQFLLASLNGKDVKLRHSLRQMIYLGEVVVYYGLLP